MSSTSDEPVDDGRDRDDVDADTEPEDVSRLPVSRRGLLAGAAVAGAGVVGAFALGGDGSTPDDGSGTGSTATPRATPVPADEARTLAEQFAPTLYFGRREQWFPTDPRPYTSQRDGETVVDGFDALEGYTAAKRETDAPDPTAFYHVLEYTERLAVVQYWLYSAFDQFSVNFHWHDWELLQAFVDRDTGEPVLYVASAHSRKVPNNEFVDPDSVPAIISEVGSHSSALGMNASRDTFQRLPTDGLIPDVTNGVLEIASGEEGLPLAYGLPRDEGFRLPYVVPELDGAPLTDHPDLPSVSAEDLVSQDVTVRSFTDLATPPTDLPEREQGAVFEPESREGGDVSADEYYTLVPTGAVEDIAAFTGPQLSFEFYVPGFVEDAVSSHITTTSPPWTQPRYRDPLADITDRAHRETLAERYDLDVESLGETVVGRIAELRPTDDVDVGVTLAAPPIEAVARLASEPTAVPTFGGVAAFVDVEPGEHTLTVNGPGYAPYAQRVSVGGEGTTETAASGETGTETATETETATSTATETATSTESVGSAVRVGTDGSIGLVPAEDAVKLNVDAGERGGARRVRVDDDVAGRVFDAPPVQSQGNAGVYVHRAGGYTVEVTDERGETSVERVNPGPNQNAAEVAKARTGVSGVTRFLVDFLTETRESVERLLERGGGGGGGNGNGNGDEDDRNRGNDGDRSERGSRTNGRSGPDANDPERRPVDAASTPSAETTTTGLRAQVSQTDGSDEEDGEADGRESTETATSTPTPEPTATATPTPTPESTATPSETPTPDSTTRTTARDELRRALDDAVSEAERANEAALAGEDAATAEALRGLRDVLSRLTSLPERDDAPQPAARIAARRAATADQRAARALEMLEA